MLDASFGKTIVGGLIVAAILLFIAGAALASLIWWIFA